MKQDKLDTLTPAKATSFQEWTVNQTSIRQGVFLFFIQCWYGLIWGFKRLRRKL